MLRQRLQPGTRIKRHRHAVACVAIVIDGGYLEAGDNGRWRTQPGDVLVYQPFTSHLNFIPKRSSVLNLPLPHSALQLQGRYLLADVDQLVVTAERDKREATEMLLEQLLSGRPSFDSPIDRIAVQLASPDAPDVQALARQLGVCRTTVFRWFRSVYGIGPASYRTETRARRAWLATVTSSTPLASLAVDLGYTDQAHLSRSIRALTGMTPRQWRATFLQDSSNPA